MTSGVIVEVGARRFAIPFECPCCGAAPDTDVDVALEPVKDRPVAPETAHALGFPYCRACVAHAIRWDTSTVLETGVKVLGLLVALALGLGVHLVVGVGVFVAGIAVSVVLGRARRAQAQAACGPACAAPGFAVAYHGWSGNATTLAFASHVYAARFAEQNVDQLVDVSPQLRQVLEGYKLARLAVPTPAAAVRTLPTAADVTEWIARIERAPGRVARLDALQRALAATADPVEQRALIAAAARLELTAITARLDALAGPAQQRAVQQAIAQVRADNIPEALRDELVGALEPRLG